MQYMFFLDGQPKTSWVETPSWTWTTSTEKIGSHSIEAKVKDNKHNPDGDSSKAIDFVISAPPNNPPAITDLASEPASPQVAGAAVTFAATSSDPEQDPVQYMFVLDGQPKTSWMETASWTWTTSTETIGSHSIEVKVKDNKHNQEGDSSKAIDFVISAPPNNPPAITDLASEPASPQVAGAAVTFAATSSDPEQDPVQYMFLLDGQPKTSWMETASWTWTTSTEMIGSHSIEVKVKDNKHNQEGDSSKAIDFVISAPPNNPPAITDLASEPASPQVAGAAVTFAATSSDPEQDPVQYMFLLDGQPKTSWMETASWTWTTSTEMIGSHSIEVKVKDNKHNQEGDSSKAIDFVISAPEPAEEPVNIEVVPAVVAPTKLNESPTLDGLTADSISPQLLGTSITWTASASDAENDPISYRFLVNGTPATDWQPENQWTWTAMQPGTSQIMVQVKDGLHEGPQGKAGNMSSDFSIIAPAPETKPVVEPARLKMKPCRKRIRQNLPLPRTSFLLWQRT